MESAYPHANRKNHTHKMFTYFKNEPHVSCLPNHPEKVCSQLQNTFYTYIWEDCHKIKRSVVTKDYERWTENDKC